MSRPGDRIDRRLKAWLRYSQNKLLLWPVVLKFSGPDRWEKEIVAGCKAFGLDATNSDHRHILLGILAEIHFGEPSSTNALAIPVGDSPKKPRGRPPVKSHNARAIKLRRQVVKSFPEAFVDPPAPLKPFPTANAIYLRLGKKWFQQHYGNLKGSSVIEKIRRDLRP